MTVGELHKNTGIAKPTLVRILETLQHARYVGQRNPELRYAVTAKVLQLGTCGGLGKLGGINVGGVRLR